MSHKNGHNHVEQHYHRGGTRPQTHQDESGTHKLGQQASVSNKTGKTETGQHAFNKPDTVKQLFQSYKYLLAFCTLLPFLLDDYSTVHQPPHHHFLTLEIDWQTKIKILRKIKKSCDPTTFTMTQGHAQEKLEHKKRAT